MKRKPRGPGERLFGPTSLLISCLQGLVRVRGGDRACIPGLSGVGQSIAEARTLAFITLIVSNLCLILTNRSWSQTAVSAFSAGNPALLWVVGGALVFLGLVVYVPGLRDLFHFAPMHVAGHCHRARRRAREHRLVRGGQGPLRRRKAGFNAKSVSWRPLPWRGRRDLLAAPAESRPGTDWGGRRSTP